MSHKVLLFVVLIVSLAAFSQTGAGNQPSNSGQTGVNTNPTQTIPVGNGLSWAGGAVGYYGEGPVSGTLLSTPTATFDSPLPTAGISIAGRAGISDLNPVNTAVQSTLNSSTLVFSNVPPDMATATISPATAAVSSGRPTTDMGPSFFSNQIGAMRNDNPSLGEIAAHYQSLQPQGLRTYTNADVRPPKNFAADEGTVLASNMPPVLSQPGTSAARASSNRPSVAAQENSTQGAENTEQSESKNTSQNDRLPATSTVLPLLALLGITSSGVGLLFRRRRA